jgi:hypothetical protein
LHIKDDDGTEDMVNKKEIFEENDMVNQKEGKGGHQVTEIELLT